MNASEKQQLAFKLVAQAKELGLEIKTHGTWIEFGPPGKAPTQFTVDLLNCQKEFRKIAKEAGLLIEGK